MKYNKVLLIGAAGFIRDALGKIIGVQRRFIVY